MSKRKQSPKSRNKKSAISKNAPLNERQRRFIDAFMVCGTPVEAARRAGYKSVYVEGTRLLKRPAVVAEIARRREELRKKDHLDRDQKKQLLAQAATDSKSEWKDRLKAIDLDNKMDGVYVERHEHEVSINGPIDKLCEAAAEQLRAMGWKVEPPADG